MTLAIVAILCSGCAGYQAYREGNARLENGDALGGLEKLHEATLAAPNNTEFRQGYFVRRDTVIHALSATADKALESDQFEPAQANFERILKIEPNNGRALEGLIRLKQASRHKVLLDSAEGLAQKRDFNGALLAIREVLNEHPGQPRATALRQQYTRQLMEVSGKEFGPYPKLAIAYRKPVTINFTNATLLQVFESMRLASGLNFMLDKDVRSDTRVTLHVTAKPVEDVIRLVLATNQLDRRVLDEDTLLIYPNTTAKQTEYRELVIRSFYLSHADIRQVANMLRTMVKVKDVFVDEKLNILMIRDSIEVVRLAEKLVANQDVPDSEVMLELEVLEVSTSRLMELGIQWPTSVSASVRGAAGTAGQLSLNELRNRNAGLVNLTFNDPLVAAKLLEQRSDSDLLANPRIRVRNRETAKVLIGQRVPVITTTATANVGATESISYLDVGLKLEIVPTIALDEEVSMKVALEVSSIQSILKLASGAQAYTLGTRNAATVLRVRNNETQILAGLIQRDQQNANNGVPGINNIPILNKLFGQGINNDNKTEVVLLITPRVVRSVLVPSIDRTEILSGTEAAMGASPIQLGQTAGPANSTIPQVQRNSVAPAPPQNPARTQAVNPSPQLPPAFSAPPLVPQGPSMSPFNNSPRSQLESPGTGPDLAPQRQP